MILVVVPGHVHISVAVQIRDIERANASDIVFDDMGGPTGLGVFEPDDARTACMVSGARDVQVAVAVHVHRLHFVGIFGRYVFDDLLGPDPSALVLPPGEFMGAVCRSQNVRVTVAVQVGGMHVHGSEEAPVDQMGLPLAARAVLVFKPQHIAAAIGGARHIQVAVAVHIRRPYADRAVEGRIHGPLGPGFSIASVVLPPGHFVGGLIACDNVHVPVAVHIRSDSGRGAAPSFFHHKRSPLGRVSGDVLMPGHVAACGNCQNIHVPVAIHVRRMHIRGACFRNVRHLLLFEIQSPGRARKKEPARKRTSHGNRQKPA